MQFDSGEVLGPWVNRLLELLAPITLAMFGGLVAFLNRPDQVFSWRLFLAKVLLSALAGMVVYSLLTALSFGEWYKVAATAVSGFASNEVLRAAKNRLIRQIETGGTNG